jgi:hypothetical protein
MTIPVSVSTEERQHLLPRQGILMFLTRNIRLSTTVENLQVVDFGVNADLSTHQNLPLKFSAQHTSASLQETGRC